MPANRSRTLEWRRCLRQVLERGGALEIAVAKSMPSEGVWDETAQLVWRVRLLNVTETEIIVEQPSALGQAMQIQPGVSLAVVLAIGQNRWMFATPNLGTVMVPGFDRRPAPALRLAMPESVQRCQRRNYYRVEATSIELPRVDLWPLLEPRSVLLAERACEIQWEIENGRLEAPADGSGFQTEAVMPEVGPKFGGTLLNLGGGGMGMRVSPEDSQIVARHKLLWMRLGLPQGLSVPICATGKVVHTHMESNQDTYVGIAFDFSFNPSHQKFVVDQICRYIAWQQRMQTLAAPGEQRKSA